MPPNIHRDATEELQDSSNTADFDLSIVLNLHDEARFLRRTMRSLEDAIMFAQRDGSTIELVVVLDNPDDATSAWVDRYDFSVFNTHQILRVDNRSLGASRNDGVHAARGHYIATADGDDLVSYNMYASFLNAARAGSELNVYVPEYVFLFEGKTSIRKYFGSEHLPLTAFFDFQPYVSRICASADLFRKLPYHPISQQDDYAFEDWHFNCEAIANGCLFVPTPGTILFYRSRDGSITHQLESEATKVIPPSSFFKPSIYINLNRGKDFSPLKDKLNADLISYEVFIAMKAEIVELVAAANAIEPGISWKTLSDASRIRTNLVSITPAGSAYLRALELIGDDQFTDVIIMDGVVLGGAEKFILDIIDSRKELGVSKNVLALISGRIDKGTQQLPDGVTAIDLVDVCGNESPEILNLLTLRLIQATAKGATVHLKSSEYGRAFMEQYGRLLREELIVFYYFSDLVNVVNKVRITDGCNFSSIAYAGDQIDLVISDHTRNLHELRTTLDCFPTMRIETIYSKVDLPQRRKTDRQRRSEKLLWASRVSIEKRPDLLVKLGRGLARSRPAVDIDVYGVSQVSTAHLRSAPRISYRGPYNRFSDLRPEQYDGFLYTSAFDGLPNVILEAMAHGLPIIAPDIGGISEVVTESTGFLIEDDADDDVLVAHYLEAINRLYNSESDITAKLQNARALLEERHSAESHLRRVSDVFDCARQRGVALHAIVQDRSLRSVAEESTGGKKSDVDMNGDSKTQELNTDDTDLRTSLEERDAQIRSLRRELQDQRARTLYYASKVPLLSTEQRDVSMLRLKWRRIRARLGLPRLGSLRRGWRAFAAAVFQR